MTSPLVLRSVEVAGVVTDVLLERGAVAAVGSLVVPPGAEVIDGRGGALVPGLWDHHLHLASLAAWRASVVVGPPAVRSAAELGVALRTATARSGWIRAVGYHESVAGELDRDVLDRLAPPVPVRVQHRSGAMWVLNSSALVLLGLDDAAPAGVERDRSGRPTGRVLGGDVLLRALIGSEPPDLAAVGRELASYGVTGVTDATPSESSTDLDLLAAACRSGALPQRVVAMGGPPLTGATFPSPLGRGPVKLLLTDHSLPGLDDLVAWMRAAHDAGRSVAVHVVTRAAMVLALAAFDDAGVIVGDRIEHAAVAPPELAQELAARSLTVVTQPAFVAERGDEYLDEVDAADRPHLYPCRTLLDRGVPVGGSTDAPFGNPDPWRAIRAAVERTTAGGRPIGRHERLPAGRALDLFLSPPDAPGGPPRRVAVGAAADLCLLDGPLSDVLRDPSADRVRLTVIGAAVVDPER